MDEINTDIIFEKVWDHSYLHIDVNVPYEENYQMKMLRNNPIQGLLKVTASGRDGNSRFTFRTQGAVSLEKKYETQGLGGDVIARLSGQLADLMERIRDYLLDPDCILLCPEYIFETEGQYLFCYLPIRKQSLYHSFHELTEFFVKKLDYKDTEGIFLAYMLHKATLQGEYDLKEIMEKYKNEAKEREDERKEKPAELAESAMFTLEEEEEKEYHVKTDAMPLMEEKRYGKIKKVIGRIRAGRWGEWGDLITELDDRGERL